MRATFSAVTAADAIYMISPCHVAIIDADTLYGALMLIAT